VNDSQKTVLVLAGIAVVASIVFCPHIVTDIHTNTSYVAGVPSTESRTTSHGYGWVWDAPSNSSLDSARLVITWVAIVTAGAVLFAVNAGSGKK
jgi:hypothetical protein